MSIRLSLTIITMLTLCFSFAFGAGPVSGQKDTVTLSILFDNYEGEKGCGLETSWGFACLVKGTSKTILFDTGSKGEILLNNFSRLGLKPEEVEAVVISHEHWDHLGGVGGILAKKPGLPVYYPVSATKELTPLLKQMKPMEVKADQPLVLCPGVHLTGEMKGPINEQAMILETSRGLVVITGCAHPGIVSIVEKAKKQLKKDIYLVMGGFHLGKKSKDVMDKIIRRFKELGVKKVAPTHCTGDTSIDAFKKAYGENYIRVGVGKVIEI